MHKLLNTFLYTILLLLGVAPFAYAQLGVVPAPVQYIVSPETPGPNQQVSIEAQGVGTFLGDSTITWSKNGKVVLTGVGERVFSFTTGALGVQTSVRVSIQSRTQGTIVQEWLFIPSAINLVWEADTSTPPLYKGKALYSAGATVKVVAYPTIVVNGKALPSNSLSFQWRRKDQPVPSASGVGRNIFNFSGDQLQTEEVIAVDVYYGASKLGSGEVVIPVSAPQIVLYAKDPLRGMLLDSALPTGISLNSKEFTLQAVPYFFDNNSLKNGSAPFVWTLNGDETTGPNATKGVLTLRQTGSGTGSAVIGVSIQNNNDDMLVQAAQSAIQIVFGGSSSESSLFGL